MYTVAQIADWFLAHGSMTLSKLQELTYYTQGWSNALLKKPLISTEFVAQSSGAVSNNLLEKYSDYSYTEIPQKKDYVEEINNPVVEDLLNSVWATYGNRCADELIALTHKEPPWKKARKRFNFHNKYGNIISDKDMEDYYLSIYIGD